MPPAFMESNKVGSVDMGFQAAHTKQSKVGERREIYWTRNGVPKSEGMKH
jgi:hypothetical protein